MREKILNVVAQLINRYGLKKFTVDEVAATLRISKNSLSVFRWKRWNDT